MDSTGSSSPRLRSILSIGLKANHHFDTTTIARHVAEQSARTHRAGFELVHCMFDIGETGNLERLLRDTIATRSCWDGVLIGFGLRSEPALTVIFERTVNVCLDIIVDMKNGGSLPRFVFNSAPDNTAEAVFRVFGVVDG